MSKPLVKDIVWELIHSKWMSPSGFLKIMYFKKRFLIWNGKCWLKHSKDEVYDQIVRAVHAEKLLLEDSRDFVLRDVLRNLSAVCAVTKLNKGKRQKRPDEPSCFYHSFNNGILRIETGKRCAGVTFIPHDPDVFVTSTKDFEYSPRAGCPTFFEFIHQILDRKEVMFVQEWMGLSLLPNNPTQKLAIYFGPGANGKSSLLVVHQMLIGEDDVSNVPLKEFLPNAKFGLILTEDKLLNIAEELDDYGYLASSALKNYVTQGKIIVQEKHQNLYSIKATAKLLFATNSLPQFRDHSEGLNRRVEIVPFTRSFKRSEDQNKNYSSEEYWKNLKELPGVLNFALKGLKRLVSNDWKFTQSEERDSILEYYKKSSNPAVQFLKDYYEPSEYESDRVSCRKMFKDYTTYCKTWNLPIDSAVAFGRYVANVFPCVSQTKGALPDEDGVRTRSWKYLKEKVDRAETQNAQIDSKLKNMEISV